VGSEVKKAKVKRQKYENLDFVPASSVTAVQTSRPETLLTFDF
jgi:hypothetical protein